MMKKIQQQASDLVSEKRYALLVPLSSGKLFKKQRLEAVQAGVAEGLDRLYKKELAYALHALPVYAVPTLLDQVTPGFIANKILDFVDVNVFDTHEFRVFAEGLTKHRSELMADAALAITHAADKAVRFRLNEMSKTQYKTGSLGIIVNTLQCFILIAQRDETPSASAIYAEYAQSVMTLLAQNGVDVVKLPVLPSLENIIRNQVFKDASFETMMGTLQDQAARDALSTDNKKDPLPKPQLH